MWSWHGHTMRPCRSLTAGRGRRDKVYDNVDVDVVEVQGSPNPTALAGACITSPTPNVLCWPWTLPLRSDNRLSCTLPPTTDTAAVAPSHHRITAYFALCLSVAANSHIVATRGRRIGLPCDRPQCRQPHLPLRPRSAARSRSTTPTRTVRRRRYNNAAPHCPPRSCRLRHARRALLTRLLLLPAHPRHHRHHLRTTTRDRALCAMQPRARVTSGRI